MVFSTFVASSACHGSLQKVPWNSPQKKWRCWTMAWNAFQRDDFFKVPWVFPVNKLQSSMNRNEPDTLVQQKSGHAWRVTTKNGGINCHLTHYPRLPNTLCLEVFGTKNLTTKNKPEQAFGRIGLVYVIYAHIYIYILIIKSLKLIEPSNLELWKSSWIVMPLVHHHPKAVKKNTFDWTHFRNNKFQRKNQHIHTYTFP